jgi:ubiquinone/menaquinone biosynthesis C-methylase UbiE
MAVSDAITQTLAQREAFRERYQRERDPITSDRLLWRAQTLRHMVHSLAGQTILELGAGDAQFARQLAKVSREQSPITAVTFSQDAQVSALPAKRRILHVERIAGKT